MPLIVLTHVPSFTKALYLNVEHVQYKLYTPPCHTIPNNISEMTLSSDFRQLHSIYLSVFTIHRKLNILNKTIGFYFTENGFLVFSCHYSSEYK